MATSDDALEREARRIYFRYATEVVEAFALCPWARHAREAGRVECRVIRGANPSVETLLAHVQAAQQARDIEVTLLVMPECTLERNALRRLTAALHVRYDEAEGRGKTAFAIADFHPEGPLDLRSAERLTPFIRRSPDPTLQLIRHDALERARHGSTDGTRTGSLEMMLAGALKPMVPAHVRVSEANHKTIERIGVATVIERLADIAHDRTRAYAQVGASFVQWRTHEALENVASPT